MGKTDRYEWVDVGSAFVPSEVSCAILWSQLGEGQALIEKRLAHCRMYTEGLQPLVQKRLLQVGVVPDDCVGNGHIFFLILPSKEKREHLGKYLHGKGVAAFTHYAPLHCAPAGRKYGRVGSGSEDMRCALTLCISFTIFLLLYFFYCISFTIFLSLYFFLCISFTIFLFLTHTLRYFHYLLAAPWRLRSGCCGYLCGPT